MYDSCSIETECKFYNNIIKNLHKILSNVFVAADGTKIDVVKRECHKDSLNEFTDGECKKDEKGGKHVSKCVCDSDLCNSKDYDEDNGIGRILPQFSVVLVSLCIYYSL